MGPTTVVGRKQNHILKPLNTVNITIKFGMK